MAPGANRPWLIESDDVNHPSAEEAGLRSGLEDARVTASWGTIGSSRVRWSTRDRWFCAGGGVAGMVPPSGTPAAVASFGVLPARARPQVAQKRASSCVGAPQCGQNTAAF